MPGDRCIRISCRTLGIGVHLAEIVLHLRVAIVGELRESAQCLLEVASFVLFDCSGYRDFSSGRTDGLGPEPQGDENAPLFISQVSVYEPVGSNKNASLD